MEKIHGIGERFLVPAWAYRKSVSPGSFFDTAHKRKVVGTFHVPSTKKRGKRRMADGKAEFACYFRWLCLLSCLNY